MNDREAMEQICRRLGLHNVTKAKQEEEDCGAFPYLIRGEYVMTKSAIALGCDASSKNVAQFTFDENGNALRFNLY